MNILKGLVATIILTACSEQIAVEPREPEPEPEQQQIITREQPPELVFKAWRKSKDSIQVKLNIPQEVVIMTRYRQKIDAWDHNGGIELYGNDLLKKEDVMACIDNGCNCIVINKPE